MRKYSMFLFALPLLAVVGCNPKVVSSVDYGEYEVITAADIENEADLTEIAYDFRIHPLKCDGPLDGIGGIKTWDNVMLARSSDDKKILRFDDYKLTWVLNRLGRGPGEYYFIEDFSYDKANNCIYIENDSNLVTYDATTMEFKGKQPVNIAIQNVLNLGDQMLYFGYFLDDYHSEIKDNVYHVAKESMILVDRDERDLTKGVVLYQESSLQRSLMGYPELFYVNPKNRATCLTGLVNRIVTFDNEKTTDVYRFKLGDGPINTTLEELFQVEDINIEDLSNMLRNVSMDGPMVNNVYNIMADGDNISFRVTYSNPNSVLGEYSRYLYFVHDKKGTKVYRHLRIPGLAMDVDPTGANGNHQIAIIENLGDMAIDESVPMSPLAEQIVAELKKQNDDNPVLIEFRFK